jgi:serine/threonine protein kinase
MLAINEVLRGRYRINKQLGRGGMGAVYEAYDNVFDTTVALKEILVDLTKVTTPKQQQMVRGAFEREAKILAMVKHEAFPHVRDYFVETDRQYLVMELVDGEDLASLLERRQAPFPLANVLHWTSQLLDALDYLHTLNPPVIHRDIKPQNLKLTSRGKIKLLDFGIAKGKDSAAQAETVSNQTFVAATLNYSPLEQILRVLDPTFQEVITQRHDEKSTRAMSHNADARSDLYALGATIYHLLTNKLPIDALKRALEIWGGKADPLEYPTALNAEIPKEIADWIMKAMEIEYENRFATANEMLAALQNALENERNREEESKFAGLSAEQERKRAELAAQQQKIEEERRRMEEERRRIEEQQLKQAEINRKMLEEAETKRKQAEQQAADAEKRLLDSMGNQLDATIPLIKKEEYFPETSLPPSPPQQEKPPASPFDQPTQFAGNVNAPQQTVLSNPASKSSENIFPPSTPTITSPNQGITNSLLADSQQKKSSKAFWIVPILGLLFLLGGGAFGIMYLMQPDSGGGEGNNTIVNGKSPTNSGANNSTNTDKTPTAPEGMVLVKGEEFTMGTDKGDVAEMPAHKKTVKSFFMDKTEVTREDYEKCVRAGKCTAPTTWTNGGTFAVNTGKFPVVGVNYSQAQAYAKFVNKRLPTEEEWEFAARGTDKRIFPWGNTWEKGKANANGEGKTFVEVGKFSGVSPFGIYDMVGNAWEWTSSEFKAYPNGKLPADAPKGDVRVIRGGSYESADKFATTTYRVGWLAQGAPTYDQTSFRCVKDIE